MALNPNQIINSLWPAYRDPTTIEGVATGNYANSSGPSSASLSNTAAGYTTLGGKFQFAAVAGAATDYALFAYQVPAGFRLWIDGVSISTINTGAADATTSTILEWALGVGSTGVSLATADGSGPPVTVAPRRVGLGFQGWLTGAAIGQQPISDVVRYFANALRVDGGRYLHIILQIPVGTATASEVFRGNVTIDGYFESTNPTV